MIIDLFFEIIEKQNHQVKLFLNYFLKSLHLSRNMFYLLINDTFSYVSVFDIVLL